jgi:tetraacyldisaccharide 4'-kinase
MPLLKVLLWPFTVLYNLVMKVRNYLFDIGHTPSFKFETVIISVGNLNVGGSGKTPMVEYLVRLLGDRYSVAILSRGYGRKTRGIRLAAGEDDAVTLGDEPYQYYRKYGSRVTVCVGEDRVLAIPTILNERPATQIILLDDAFQHRSVVPQFSILLTEYLRPFYKDFLMPFGRLRESRSGAARADSIIVTKCGELIEQGEMEEGIHRYAGDKPIFFSTFNYKSPESFLPESQIGNKVVLVSGVANSSSLESFVSTHFQLVKHFRFGDHHFHSIADVLKVQSFAHEHQVDSILTTEKDMVKLISPRLKSVLQGKSWFYLPVETTFVKNGVEFDKLILQSVEDNLKADHHE